jgi:hypothetical protein
LHNPGRVLKQILINLPNLFDKFRLSFQNKSVDILLFLDKLTSPQNSTGKTGTQICDARQDGSRGGPSCPASSRTQQ